MRLELDSGFPPNKIDTIFAYYEVGFLKLRSSYQNCLAILNRGIMSWLPKPWVWRSNRESWKVCDTWLHISTVIIDKFHQNNDSTFKLSYQIWSFHGTLNWGSIIHFLWSKIWLVQRHVKVEIQDFRVKRLQHLRLKDRIWNSAV